MGRRSSRNQFTTHSGKTIKVNRNLVARWVTWRDDLQRRKAERLAGLPKGRVKRFFYHFQPSRMYHYWFSREGAIMALKIFGITIAASFLLLIGLFAYFRKDLPNLKDDIYGKNLGGSTQYYDRTGKVLLWEDYDAVKRIPVKDKDISTYMKQATVAIEDKDFFKHGGFDVRGIIRAGWNNVFGGSGTTQGGSTITQQLVKLTQNWTLDRSYARKIKEIILAVELERTYSKQEILSGYLNVAPYGGIEYGVEAAARDYFNKSADELSLAEATMLAAIPKSPRYYSPYSADFDKASAVGRQRYILDQMVDQGMISKEKAAKAKKVNVIAAVKPRPTKFAGIKAPYFVLTAKEQLENEILQSSDTAKRGGWKVTTTLDLEKQKQAEQVVQNGIYQVRAQGGDEIGFAAEDVPTGQMVALVGGVDFTDKDHGQNNYARLRIPPGSSFKPYDYISLLENTTNSGAGSVLYDKVGPLPGYPCTNHARPRDGGNCLVDYDFRQPGPLSLRYALGGSLNIPAVKAMLIAGIDKTRDVAKKLGLKSGYNCYVDDKLTKEGPCYGSSAIGDGAYLKLDEHVHGFASISRDGVNLPQTYILKITDARSKPLYEWKKSKGEQAVRPDAAYIVADMISDPNASYLSRKTHIFNNWRFGVKTGTTNDGKDGLMMSFSTKYAAGVWVGYHNRQRVMSGFMETMTQPIISNWMNQAHTGLQPVERKRPSGVKTLPAYVVRSHVGVASVEPSPSTDIFPSWYQPKKVATKSEVIDIVSNKLATNCTPDRAKKTVNNAAVGSFSSDTFVNGGNSTGTDKDDIHKCGDARPTIDGITVDDNGGGVYKISVQYSPGTHPLTSDKFPFNISVSVDGKSLKLLKKTGGYSTFQYTTNSDGSKTISVQVTDSVLYGAQAAESYNFQTGSVQGVNSNSNGHHHGLFGH